MMATSQLGNFSDHQVFLQRRFGLELEDRLKERSGRRANMTPLGPIREWRYLHHGREVAHHRFIPVELWYQGQRILGVQLSDAWVDEAFRGFGLSPLLLQTGFATLHAEGHQFAYGFPRLTNWQNLVRYGGMQDLGACHFLVKPARMQALMRRWSLPRWVAAGMDVAVDYGNRLNRVRGRSSRYRVTTVSDFPEHLGALLEGDTIVGNASAYFVRTEAQLRWRFAHPDYRKCLCMTNDGTVVGMLVARQDQKEGVETAAILDLSLDHSLGEEMWPVFKALVCHFEASFPNADLWSALTVPGTLLDRMLKKLLYAPLPTQRFGRSFWFLFRWLGAPRDVEPLRNWHATFYDSLDSF